MQCGYCAAGMIMAAAALLETMPDPTHDQIVRAMNGNVCRCGAYPQIGGGARSRRRGSRHQAREHHAPRGLIVGSRRPDGPASLRLLARHPHGIDLRLRENRVGFPLTDAEVGSHLREPGT
jgi:hypothetical protein